METSRNLVNLSKFLSLILRHKPQTVGIELDKQGWTNVHDLISKLNRSGKNIDFKTLEIIVETDNKKRYEFNPDKTKIRASQGHSVNVDLGYTPQAPPEFLYHGTADKFVGSILEKGIQKRNRHHVHLSLDIETAKNVGKRHGMPSIFKIFSQKMHKDGYVFFKSTNGVWLTEEVPVNYMILLD